MLFLQGQRKGVEDYKELLFVLEPTLIMKEDTGDYIY